MDTALQRDGKPVGSAVLLPCYGLAALRAGWSVVRQLRVEGLTGAVRVRIPEIHYVEEFDVASGTRIEEHGAERVAAIEAALEAVQRPLSLIAHFELAGQRLGGAPTTILPPWSWPLLEEARVLSAAYVLPAEPALTAVVGEVSRSDRGETVQRLQALYDTLAQQLSVRLEAPHIQEEPWSGCLHQDIRASASLFASVRSTTAPGVVAVPATCLDLSLLFAAALEALGRAPLLLFLGDATSEPEHVLVGVWRQAARRLRPLLTDAAAIRQAVACGDMLVVEATGVCRDASQLDFAAAQASAARRVAQAAALVAVDVCAARPPLGSIAPLTVAYGPAVARALAESRQLAERSGAAHNESVHVLYGLCVAAGELTTWLLESRGSNAAAVVRRIEASLSPGNGAGPPVPTRNHTTCLSTARGNARSRGSSSVEEGDLLWALLENPSASIRRVLEAEGCRLSWLQRELGTRFERPGISTSLSWTAPQTETSRSERSADE